MDCPLDAPAAQPRVSYFLRHWRGELSLAPSFWVNNVLLSLIWLPLLGLAPILLVHLISVTSPWVGFGALLIVMCVIGTWQIVGTWRSARRHRARGGRTLWMHVVSTLILFGWGYFVCALVEVDSYAAFKSVWQQWRSGQQLPSFHVLLLAPDELGIVGRLSMGSAYTVRQQLNAHPEVTRVQLSSDGGLPIEALAIAEQVRSRGLITYTDGDCLSGCTTVFRAGRERWLGPEGRLGFHAAAFHGLGMASKLVDKIYRQAMLDDGMSDEFVEQVLDTHPDSMWFPGEDTLRREHIITSRADPAKFADFADWRLISLREPGRIDTYLRSSVMFRIMEQKAPQQFALEKQQVVSALAQAKRFGPFNARNTQRQNELVERAMRQAPVALALDFWRNQLDYLDELGQVGGDACWEYLTGKVVRSPLPAQIESARQAVEVRLLEGTLPLREDDPSVPTTVDADLDGIFDRIEQQLPQAYEHLRRGDRATLCAVRQAFYREALALPDPQRAVAALVWVGDYRR